MTVEVRPGTVSAVSGAHPTTVHIDEVELMAPDVFLSSAQWSVRVLDNGWRVAPIEALPPHRPWPTDATPPMFRHPPQSMVSNIRLRLHGACGGCEGDLDAETLNCTRCGQYDTVRVLLHAEDNLRGRT